MKISKKLPQFEEPTLFITSGEYESRFYLAHNGQIDLKKTIKLAPREEAKEKQGFIGKKGGRMDLASVSHHGAYIEDLKRRFQKENHAVIHDFIYGDKINEIVLFAPRYVSRRIMAGIDGSEKHKVRMKFYEELTKYNPTKMIARFWEEAQRAVAIPRSIKKEEKNILKKPKLKKPKRK